MTSEYSFNQPEAHLDPGSDLESGAEQEPGAAGAPSLSPAARTGPLLPLEASVDPSSGTWAGGWEIRLPLRAEQVTIEKRPVVVEEVVIRRRPLEEVVRLEDTVQLERLRLETRGDLAATRPTGVEGTEEEAPGWTRQTERIASVRPES